MGKPARYRARLSPSGWEVYEVETNQCIKQLGASPGARIDALKVVYTLNGWSLPKIWK